MIRQPEILLLSSSRGYFFMEDLFIEEDSFYNASTPGMTPDEILTFMQRLIKNDVTPSLILVNLDYRFFTEAWSDTSINTFQEAYSTTDTIRTHFLATIREWVLSPQLFYQDIVNIQHPTYRAIGLHSIRNDEGFRNDGSHYRPQAEVGRLQEIERYRDLFERGVGIFQSSETLSTSSIETYEQLLALAEANNITIIGYFPPYITEFYEGMITDTHFPHVEEIQNILPDVFANYGMPLFFFNTPASVGGTDLELFDGHHSGEILSWRMMTAMVEQAPHLFEPYTTLDHLQSIQPTTDSYIYLFGNIP